MTEDQTARPLRAATDRRPPRAHGTATTCADCGDPRDPRSCSYCTPCSNRRARESIARNVAFWAEPGRDPYAGAAPRACTRCGAVKPALGFGRSKHRRSGLNGRCLPCNSAQAQESLERRSRT